MHILLFVRGVALGAFLVAAQASGQPGAQTASSNSTAATPAADTLPEGPGRDTVMRVCSACHSPSIATKQRLNKNGWHDLVETMVGRGAQGSDSDFAQIVDYLAKNYPDKSGK